MWNQKNVINLPWRAGGCMVQMNARRFRFRQHWLSNRIMGIFHFKLTAKKDCCQQMFLIVYHLYYLRSIIPRGAIIENAHKTSRNKSGNSTHLAVFDNLPKIRPQALLSPQSAWLGNFHIPCHSASFRSSFRRWHLLYPPRDPRSLVCGVGCL